MGLAFSETTIVYRDILATNSATLRSELHTAAGEAGWTATTVTGGYLYTLTSPQELVCEVKVWDDGTPNVITVQFRSQGGSNAGYEHRLQYGTGLGYRIWLNVCQLFVWLPGSYLTQNRVVCGGIPRVPNPAAAPLTGTCAADYGSDDEDAVAWWSCGDQVFAGPTFRTRWLLDTIGSGYRFSACHNGNLQKTGLADYQRQHTLRLIPVSYADGNSVEYLSFGHRPHVRWSGSDQPLLLDPLIAWGGPTLDTPARIRGEVWDAMIVSQKVTMDAVQTYTDGAGNQLEFIHFSGHPNDGPSPAGNFYGSLVLLSEEPTSGGSVGNVAY